MTLPRPASPATVGRHAPCSHFGTMASSPPLIFHVTYEEGGWCLWLAGAPRGAQHFARKEDAVRTGTRHAKATPPSELRVHASDGRLELQRSFPLRPPTPAPGDSSEYFLGRGSVPADEI